MVAYGMLESKADPRIKLEIVLGLNPHSKHVSLSLPLSLCGAYRKRSNYFKRLTLIESSLIKYLLYTVSMLYSITYAQLAFPYY